MGPYFPADPLPMILVIALCALAALLLALLTRPDQKPDQAAMVASH